MPRKWRPKNILDKNGCDTEGVMHKSHSCSFLVYHYVFTAKYRRDISGFDGVIQKLAFYIKEVCDNRRWPVHELAIENDHIHLQVQVPPTISPSQGARIIKCNSSRLIRLKYPVLRQMIKEDSFWSGGYYVGSVGKASMEKIKQYIQNQGLYNISGSVSAGRKPARR